MKQRSSFVFINLLAVALLSLNGCGGAGDKTADINDVISPSQNNDRTSHPKFLRQTVSLSPNFAPSGEITDTTPTFSWPAVANATEYHFGHEITENAVNWNDYVVTSSEANCGGANQECTYTPTDYTFSVGEERVWWVRAKVSGAWKAWSSSHVFTIIKDPSTGGDIPKEVAPIGDITQGNPAFSWTPVTNATDYQVGHENALTWDEWNTYTVTADQSSCANASQNCTYTPASNFAVGAKKSWWVRAKVNGAWGEWSDGADFAVISNPTTERPFVIKVKGYKVPGRHPRFFRDFYISHLYNSQLTYNYNVDCNNDGILEATGVTSSYTCKYKDLGEHTVSISGEYPAIGTSTTRGMIVDVEQWGSQVWLSMKDAFRGSRLKAISATDVPDLSHVTDMEQMFAEMFSFFPDENNGADTLNNWDVSHVTNMRNLFYRSNAANPNITDWDVSHVTNMHGTFREAMAFNQDISNWDMSKVTNMDLMFFAAHLFNQNIANWDVSRVTAMRGAFMSASAFNQDISSWDVSKVTDMGDMFNHATSFEQNIGNWDISNVTVMIRMFSGVTLSTVNYDNLLNGWSTLQLKRNDFNAGKSKYSAAGAAARQVLKSQFSWTIIDGGQQ